MVENQSQKGRHGRSEIQDIRESRSGESPTRENASGLLTFGSIGYHRRSAKYVQPKLNYNRSTIHVCLTAGGSADPEINSTLAAVLKAAKAGGVPKVNVETALKKVGLGLMCTSESDFYLGGRREGQGEPAYYVRGNGVRCSRGDDVSVSE